MQSVQGFGPAEGEVDHGLSAGRVRSRVGLDVQVDRAAFADAEGLECGDRLGGLRPALLGGVGGVDVSGLAGRVVAGRLRADVGGDEPPAHPAHLAHPVGGQLLLTAGTLVATGVDADRTVGGVRPPGPHGVQCRGRAGVEARAAVHRPVPGGAHLRGRGVGGEQQDEAGGGERGGAEMTHATGSVDPSDIQVAARRGAVEFPPVAQVERCGW